MTSSAKDRRHVLSSIFRRNGGDGNYTRLFENLEPPKQNILLAAIELRDFELPIIGNVCDSRNWLMLTTERLVWCIDNKRNELPIGDIDDAIADLAKFQREQRTKLEWNQLQIITSGSQRYSIDLEPGASLIATWNVLKNIGTRNRNRRNRPK